VSVVSEALAAKPPEWGKGRTNFFSSFFSAARCRENTIKKDTFHVNRTGTTKAETRVDRNAPECVLKCVKHSAQKECREGVCF